MSKVINVNFSHANIADLATEKLSEDLRLAIDTARDSGVAQGIVVALLQGYLHSETEDMVNGD